MTGLLTVKLRRDLRAAWSRLLLMAVAIAVSLTVFGGVLFTWATMGRESASAYAGTEPASATFVLEPGISVERMAAVVAYARSRPDVIAATGRAPFSSAVEVNGTPREIPMQIFVVTPDDAMRVARFEVEHGTWPPASDEILIGRDGLKLLNASLGDSLTILTPSGERLRLRVADTVYDPSLSPSPQEQTARGYLSTAALAASGRPALLDRLKVLIADPGGSAPSRDRATIVAAAGELGQWLQRERGVAIREIQVPEPYAHPHQWQADALLSSVLVGAAVALVLSTVLVANMLGGLFAQQIPQIGILKAIGARSRTIGTLYLAMTLLVAAVATLLALGPAVLIGRALANEIFMLLGFKVASLAAPEWSIAVVLVAGLGLPPLMALAPLIRTSRTTVRAAIDHHGQGQRPSRAADALSRLSRVRLVERGLLLALRNTMRRPARSLLSIGLLASAGAVFVAGMSLGSSLAAVHEEERAQRAWDVDVQLGQPALMEDVAAAARGTENVTRVEGWNRSQVGVASTGQIPITRSYPDGHASVSLISFPPDTTLLATPKVVDGRWLEPRETGAVVINQLVRKDTLPGVRAGDPIQLAIGGRSTSWRIVGVVEERGGAAVYTTAAGLAAVTGQPERASQLRVVTADHDEDTRTATAAAFEKRLTGAGIEVRSATSVSRTEDIQEGHLAPLISIVLTIAIAMGIVGGIGLGSTMSANVLDRVREFGVMHAIGARPAAVRRIVVAEGLFIALMSSLAAAIPAVVLTALLGTLLGTAFVMGLPLPLRISGVAVGLWIGLVFLGAILATEAAATRASRITVREALAYL